jgi:hypothetical protein
LTQLGRSFALSETPGRGVYCGEQGAFIGDVALLIKRRDPAGYQKWTVRNLSEINRELSERYGVPVEFNAKIGSLTAIAKALDRNDVFYAQLTTLHLQLTEPPSHTQSSAISNPNEVAKQLRASGLLKNDWDPQKHPRWHAGSPSGVGGEFAPANTAGGNSENQNTHSETIPVQLTIPAPIEIPGMLPPSEVLPAPLAPPIINPYHVPQNPYPDRPECVEEWAEATEYCMKLVRRGWLGRGDYKGMGKTLSQCIMGQVSEDCGGNSKGA